MSSAQLPDKKRGRKHGNCASLHLLEVAIGIEVMNNGFAVIKNGFVNRGRC